MKKTVLLLITSLILALLSAAPSLASEVVGRVVSMTDSRIVVKSREGETLRLDVSERTRFFSEEMRVPVRRVLPDTLVRIAYTNGKAEAVFIKAVPK